MAAGQAERSLGTVVRSVRARRSSDVSDQSGDPNRRVTKAEKKEQARLERERIQQQMHSRRRNRTIGIVVIAAALAAIVAVVVILQPGRQLGLGPAHRRRAPGAGPRRGGGRRMRRRADHRSP